MVGGNTTARPGLASEKLHAAGNDERDGCMPAENFSPPISVPPNPAEDSTRP